MIAKLICRSHSREEAIAKMQRALEEFVVEGIQTTIPFHKELMKNEDFRKGNFDTGFLAKWDYVSEIKKNTK
jgi:acetyl-CoA carboxylase biotin carboxylase subunit